MIRPKNDTEDLLLSITKNCRTLIDQTLGKTQETLELKLTQPKQTIQFNPLVSMERSWMLRLTTLEVYNSISILTEEIKKIQTLYSI